MQPNEQTAVSTVLHSRKVWEQFVNDIHSILKRKFFEGFFYNIISLLQKIKFTMEEKSVGELLLKCDNGNISVLVYRKSTHTD